MCPVVRILYFDLLLDQNISFKYVQTITTNNGVTQPSNQSPTTDEQSTATTLPNKTVVNTDKVEIDENDRSKGILTLPNGKNLNIYLFCFIFYFFKKKVIKLKFELFREMEEIKEIWYIHQKVCKYYYQI